MRSSTCVPRIVAALAAILFPVAAFAGAKTTSTWSAPELKPGVYKKVVVMAKITDDVARRILEDAVVQGLTERGVTAVQGYRIFTPAELENDAALETKAAAEGVDAGFLFTVTGQSTEVKSGSNVHASVGVPVRAGPFSVFVGTSVPLGGGPSAVPTVAVRSQFFAKDVEGPRWIGSYSADLKNGPERAAQDVAAQALKQIKKAGIFGATAR